MVLKSVTAILWDCVTDFLFFIQDCKSMKKAVIITILCTAFASCIYNPESLNVIPVPQQIDINPIGTFNFDEETQLYIDAPEPDRQVLLDYISTSSIASSIYAESRPAEDIIILKRVDNLPEHSIYKILCALPSF